MKNLKNMLPLFAMLLGFGLVFTQSAFTVDPEVATHYNNSTNNTPSWVPLESKVLGTGPGEYSCESAPSRACLANFDDETINVIANGILEQN